MYSTYLRLGLHVADSDIAVVRAARRLLRKEHRRGPTMRSARHNFFKEMIGHHSASRNLYRDVCLGQLDGE